VDSDLQKIFLDEIRRQCLFANMAYNDVLVAHNRVDIGRVWYSLQSFPIAFANILKIIWTKKQSPFEERGQFLRKLLDVDDSSPFKVREITLNISTKE
jgi:hypothetical protein